MLRDLIAEKLWWQIKPSCAELVYCVCRGAIQTSVSLHQWNPEKEFSDKPD